jgi:hypothetical protein
MRALDPEIGPAASSVRTIGRSSAQHLESAYSVRGAWALEAVICMPSGFDRFVKGGTAGSMK